jgi:hypothetical protein
MTPERKERILQVADELESQGITATNSAVYAIVMGHRGHVVQTLKQRRAERAAAGGVLVAEEEEDNEEELSETPAAVLQEDLTQLEHSYDAWHLALERLWEIEQDGPLSEANFSRKQWLEYQMVQNLQTQEGLRAQLDRARIREAVTAAQQEHDARLEEAQAKTEAFLQAVAAVAHLGEDLAELFSAMVDGFFKFRDLRGMQAFDIQSGFDQARQLFEAFYPNDYRARDAYLLLMNQPPTMGQLRQALEACPRLQPFSERAIATYLQQQAPEGTSTNGSHP